MSALAHTSTRQRVWLLGGAFVGFLLVLIGYFALIGPQRSETDAVNSRVAATRTQNSVLASRITALQAQNQKLATYQAQARAAMAALPATSGVPAFLRSLQTLGTQTHTDAVSVTVGTPVDVTSVATGTTGTPAAAGTTAPAATGTATPTTPSTAAPGVYSLQITTQVNGSPAALSEFLQQLQAVQPRAVLITSVTQSAASGGSGGTGTSAGATGSTLQLTMQVFAAPSLAKTAAQLGTA